MHNKQAAIVYIGRKNKITGDLQHNAGVTSYQRTHGRLKTRMFKYSDVVNSDIPITDEINIKPKVCSCVCNQMLVIFDHEFVLTLVKLMLASRRYTLVIVVQEITFCRISNYH